MKTACFSFILSALSLLCLPATAQVVNESEHAEFEALLHVPFRPDPAQRNADDTRVFTLDFDYPMVKHEQAVSWRLELIAPNGSIVRRWYGIETLWHQPVSSKIPLSARSASEVPDGLYHVRLSARSNDASAVVPGADHAATVERLLAQGEGELQVQSWPLQIGNLQRPSMPAFNALPRKAAKRLPNANNAPGIARMAMARLASPVGQPADAALPYTVVYGNLHSQTNHSDGGGNVDTCKGARAPQKGAFGPLDAYLFAKNHDLDFLVTSEHNHLYDGVANGANPAADPARAITLFQSGLAQAKQFNGNNSDFLAIYALEWGVIENGGHLNIFNTPKLLGWEENSRQQLIAETLTERGRYDKLYTLMQQNGWIGQFNHPDISASKGQFKVDGVVMAYTDAGDSAMVLCEVGNSSAFSNSIDESDTRLSNFEAACIKALEAGFHVAFSSNQDNHCANWGASSPNRTGVLIAKGEPLSSESFMNALRARRVFATMDKNSQLIFIGNGHLMGERFSNSGPLRLSTQFANENGRRVASVQIYEGVPKRNGTVKQLSKEATVIVTPDLGEHFYYAKVIQDDGKILWSAPLWVTQKAAGQP